MSESDIFQKALKYYGVNPYKYIVKFVDGFTPTNQQKQVLDILPIAIKEDKSIAVKSGHGTGKTAIAALIVLWFISVFPNPKIVCTAPSKGQLLDVLWPEIAKWQRKFKFGNDYEWTKTRLSHKIFYQDWFASARTSNSPESMAGIHGEHVLLIFEEASGIPQEVFETMEGAETEKGALKLLISNPTRTVGGFFDAFHSRKDDFYRFTFSSIESSRVKSEYADKIARKYGKDSNVYRVRVLGEFPLQEDDVVIGIDTVERAHEKFMDLNASELAEMIKAGGDHVSFGVDVARYGDDESSIYANIGKYIIKEKILKKNDTMQLASLVASIRKHKYKNFKTASFNVDETGVGSGVVDRLNQLLSDGDLPEDDNVLGVTNNSRAIDTLEYANIITELWFKFNTFLKEGGALNPDDAEEVNNIQQQCCSRKYMLDSKGRIIIESKERLKKRLNGISPDRADGAILSMADKVILGKAIVSTGQKQVDKNNDDLKKNNESFNDETSLKDRLAFFKK